MNFLPNCLYKLTCYVENNVLTGILSLYMVISGGIECSCWCQFWEWWFCVWGIVYLVTFQYHAHTRTYTHACTRTRTHTHTQTCIHTRTHTYTHTHTHNVNTDADTQGDASKQQHTVQQKKVAAADIHAMWYPTVRRSILCMSKLYRCIEVSPPNTTCQQINTHYKPIMSDLINTL